MLIDSNVIIDIINRDPLWFDWSFENVRRAVFSGDVFVNAVIVGEVAPRLGTLDAFLGLMTAMLVRVEPLSVDAGFLAGEAFQRYRQAKGPDTARSILADFLIGGHAQSVGATILTRDPRLYRTHFADVPLITPERTGND